ncbi:unnamed protein product [Strongylus vulgaris]|uniref:ShKT domain-containing protein n=1 Tax=Strongylus vulgaris TaxID=40348 RepID=A0A3P7JRG5_STRVU|nr:unnamed protein product [Strongylus vulgaris]
MWWWRSAHSSASCFDLVHPRTGVSECPQRASLCRNAAYLQLMQQQCPKTCGYCPTLQRRCFLLVSNCFDLVHPRTGVSECPQRASLCKHAAYLQLMRQQCPKTCGYLSECPQRASLCRNAAYLQLMRQQCPKTCGYCV